MLRRHIHGVGIVVLTVTLGLGNVGPVAGAAPGQAAPAQEEAGTAETQGAKDVAAEYQVENITRKAQESEPETTTSGSGGKTLLYGGIAAAAVIGAVALAAGSGGGGSSSATEEETPVATEEPKKDPVGANVDGDNWVGSLTLFDNGQREAITATVRQNGADLEITTSTAQKYGKKFIGTIGSDGNIKATDQDTGEVWSTHYGRAYWNKIDLYDYVHNDYVHQLTDYDRLYLERYSKN